MHVFVIVETDDLPTIAEAIGERPQDSTIAATPPMYGKLSVDSYLSPQSIIKWCYEIGSTNNSVQAHHFQTFLTIMQAFTHQFTQLAERHIIVWGMDTWTAEVIINDTSYDPG